MVLSEAEILEIKAELDRIKESSTLDDEHAKELEKKMREYVEKQKLMNSLLNATLKLLNKSSVVETDTSSFISMFFDDYYENKNE
ncbi:unnamed protein product [Cochlearia groenlandica]